MASNRFVMTSFPDFRNTCLGNSHLHCRSVNRFIDIRMWMITDDPCSIWMITDGPHVDDELNVDDELHPDELHPHKLAVASSSILLHRATSFSNLLHLSRLEIATLSLPICPVCLCCVAGNFVAAFITSGIFSMCLSGSALGW